MSTAKSGVRIAAFAGAYFAITSLTVGISRYGGGLALVWLGTGIAAAMLLSLPRNRWPHALVVLVLASTAATSIFGFGPRVAPLLAPINAFEAWLVARLLLFARPERNWFDDVGGLAWFVVLGGAVGPAIASLPGGYAATFAAPGGWAHHALGWWAGHALGTLIGFPIVVLVTSTPLAQMRACCSARSLANLFLHLALVLGISLLAIDQSEMPLLFLPIVPLLLASFRCGREGAVLGTLIIAGVTIWARSQGTSPIAVYALDPGNEVLFIQAYLATLSLLAIPVSVALRQYQLVLAELEERKALKHLIAENSDDALLNLDPQGSIRYASPAGALLSGESELEGKPLTLFFDPLDDLLVRGVLAQAAATPGKTVVLERPVFRDEGQLWLEARLCAVAREGQPGSLTGYAVTIRDITARKATELDAIRAAETDPLTGLPNRRVLLRQLEGALAQAEQRPFGLAILDLDAFKAINDTHGHIAGDAVLREVAAVMRRLSRPNRFFARMGGEEFALIVTHRDPAAAEALCEKLRTEIAALLFAASDDTRFRVTASIGLAHIAERIPTAQALQAADTLLYGAKDAGRNRVETAKSKEAREAVLRVA